MEEEKKHINIDLEKIKEDAKKLRRETNEKIFACILTAFGIVVALAWNDAIQSAIKLIPVEKESILAKAIYALVVTFVMVIITMIFSKFSNKDKK
jgi:uncharacterized membrane protein